MSQFFHAVEVFWDHLAAVQWHALAVAIMFHVLKALVRTFAWRNILRAAFPGARVRRRTVIGAYLAGVGVNSIAPARGGDAVKLYIARHGIEGSNYATLTSTLAVETLFDFFVASALFLWALQLGVLPSLDVLPNLPEVDWTWILRHPRLGLLFGAALALLALVGGAWVAGHIAELRRRLARGFAILGDKQRYLTEVVSWQALSWVFRFIAVWWFLKAFNVPATVENALLVLVVQSLATLLPFSPGGAGTQQGLTAYILRGKASTTALLSFSVGMTVATTATNVVLGFGAILLTLRTVRWRGHIRAKEPASARSSNP
jgi:glycosyltransferase 2 family protein